MKYTFYVLFSLSIFCSCAPSWYNELTDKPGIESCVYNAIIDFSHTSNFLKEDTVFIIEQYTQDAAASSDLIVLWISEFYYNIFPDPKDVIGQKPIWPNRMQLFGYKEINERLYLSEYMPMDSVITQDYIDILTKYNRIDYSWHSDYFFIPEGWITTNDGLRYAVYFFCPDNPKKYKKWKSFYEWSRKGVRLKKKLPKVRCD